MQMQAYVDEVKLRLTGGVLQLEIDDATIMKIINSAFREVQRYIDTTVLETIPFKPCIDLNPRKINAVVRIFRAEGFTTESSDSTVQDPMLVQQWQLLAGNGNVLSMSDYAMNYAAWSTSLQVRNTLSTDLAYRYDRNTNQLYINTSSGTPPLITIEYIPRYEFVEQIWSDYWIDILTRLSVALTKVTLGRIRSRYTQSGALWTQDGEQLLSEGNEELNSIREHLMTNTQLVYPVD